MHIKHTQHGKGYAQKAAGYLLQECDSMGEKRARVEVMRGDPHMVALVADSLDFEWKYTSGIIAWHPDDAPTPQQIEQVINDYEQMAFAGMETNGYCFSAVLHEEQDGVHVHTFAARVDLVTGLSFNPAPPGHLSAFDSVRDLCNIQHGWKRPEALENRQERTLDLAELHGKPNEDKAAIHSWLMDRVEAGQVENRADVKSSLQEICKVTREGENYISVKPYGHDKAIRLKGGIYNEQFDREVALKAGARAARSEADRRQKLEAARRCFDEQVARRADYNIQRYRRGYCQCQKSNNECDSTTRTRSEPAFRRVRPIVEAGRTEWQAGDQIRMDSPISGCSGSLDNYLREFLGSDSVLWSAVGHQPSPVAEVTPNIVSNKKPDVGSEFCAERQESPDSLAERGTDGANEERRKGGFSQFLNKLGRIYDGIRNEIALLIKASISTDRKLERAAIEAVRADQEISRASSSIKQAGRIVDQFVCRDQKSEVKTQRSQDEFDSKRLNPRL